MGFNSRSRDHDYWIRNRARQVRALEARGLALHLVVTGAKAFNDKSFVTCVLDRIHAERGIGRVIYGSMVRATYYADRWAQSRGCAVRYVARAELLRQRANGVVAFDGPADFVARARAQGWIVWCVKPRPIAWSGGAQHPVHGVDELAGVGGLGDVAVDHARA